MDLAPSNGTSKAQAAGGAAAAVAGAAVQGSNCPGARLCLLRMQQRCLHSSLLCPVQGAHSFGEAMGMLMLLKRRYCDDMETKLAKQHFCRCRLMP